MFNWKDFLDSQRIFYLTEGKNVLSGCLTINCPFCHDDPSQHLNVNIKTGKFKCWRNSSHRGNGPKLIAAIKHCSYNEAAKIYGDNKIVNNSLTLDEPEIYVKKEPVPIDPHESFDYPIWPSSRNKASEEVLKYMVDRGFREEDLLDIIQLYCVQYETDQGSKWKCRLILPILERGLWMGWTARAIYPSTYRYLSYPQDIGQLIYNYNEGIKGGDVLFLVEGPIDALKLDYYSPDNFHAVALMGKELTSGRVKRLIKLTEKYKKVYLVLDDDAFLSSMLDTIKLALLGIRTKFLPNNIHDPGEMTRDQVLEFCKGL